MDEVEVLEYSRLSVSLPYCAKSIWRRCSSSRRARWSESQLRRPKPVTSMDWRVGLPVDDEVVDGTGGVKVLSE